MCHDDAEVGDHVGGGRGASASSVGKIQDPKDKRGGARNPPKKVVLPSTLDFGCLGLYIIHTTPPRGERQAGGPALALAPAEKDQRRGPSACVRAPRSDHRPVHSSKQQHATLLATQISTGRTADFWFLALAQRVVVTGTKSLREENPKTREKPVELESNNLINFCGAP